MVALINDLLTYLLTYLLTTVLIRREIVNIAGFSD